jgi:replicative DNA helicase
LSIDRLPPQSIDAETVGYRRPSDRPRRGYRGRDFLRQQDFYRQAHGRSTRRILELYERREPVDIVTVSETLERARRWSSVAARPT